MNNFLNTHDCTYNVPDFVNILHWTRKTFGTDLFGQAITVKLFQVYTTPVLFDFFLDVNFALKF